MRVLFTLFLISSSLLSSVSVFGMSIEEELISKEKLLNLKSQENQQYQTALKAKSDEIKRKAFIVSCNPNWNGIYAFTDSKVYVSTGYSSSNAVLNVSGATFSNGVIFSQSGDTLFWRTKDHEGGFASGERWEFHLNTNRIYRKSMSDTIYKDVCNVIQGQPR